FWTTSAKAVVAVTVGIHMVAIASLLWSHLGRSRCPREPVRLRMVEVGTLTAVFFVMTVALFRIQPNTRYSTNLYPLLAGFDSALALTGTCALLIAAAALFRFEEAVKRKNGHARARIRSIALFAAAALTCVLYFDFSLYADPLHYLTNIGPALHLLHGGILMVDTFSQYGPGPIVATLLGFKVGPITFGMANLTVQLSNLAFYIIFLACLYQMTSRKLSALSLGVFSIGIMLAIWAWGEWSINMVPSALGFRHLQPLVMVLALSLMRPPNRWSLLSAAATFFAALGSVEALVGTLAIHLLFLLMVDLRERSYFRLLPDALTAMLPAGLAILFVMILTAIWGTSLPDYTVYLRFLSYYNILASFWGIAA